MTEPERTKTLEEFVFQYKLGKKTGEYHMHTVGPDDFEFAKAVQVWTLEGQKDNIAAHCHTIYLNDAEKSYGVADCGACCFYTVLEEAKK